MPVPDQTVTIDQDRLWQRFEVLSTFTDPSLPWTRRAFSDLFLRARGWLQEQMQAAGLDTYCDSAGNLIGRHNGAQPDLRAIATGSHCDTVVEGGRFDGIAGVLAGIEVAHAMKDAGITLNHPFEVIDFLSEEPSDYGISCVGSRAMAGMLTPQMLSATRSDGETLSEGMRRIGANPTLLQQPLRTSDDLAAFVELHIEQGRVLENAGLPIGVVSHIVGIRRVTMSVAGRADHAGTTPMNDRQDALLGAARVIDHVATLAQGMNTAHRYVVATVGTLTLKPNMINAVPAAVDMVIEVRSDDPDVLETFFEKLMSDIAPVLRASSVTADIKELTNTSITSCSDVVIKAIEDSAQMLGYNSMRLPSGAGHDSVYMAHIAPTGMIFIPCRQGRSHAPEEWIEPHQIYDGTKVLYQTILNLDRGLV